MVGLRYSVDVMSVVQPRLLRVPLELTNRRVDIGRCSAFSQLGRSEKFVTPGAKEAVRNNFLFSLMHVAHAR